MQRGSVYKMEALLRNSTRISSVLTRRCLRPSCLLMRSTTITTSSLVRSEEDFWSKNSRLKRPMSPHLTVYKPQLTSMLSITHRGTGIAMTAVTVSFALAALALPGNFEHYLGLVKALEIPAWIIFSGKTVLAWPLSYHSFNGIRHLAWDLGYGFDIGILYKSGWFVFFGSILAAASLAYFL